MTNKEKRSYKIEHHIEINALFSTMSNGIHHHHRAEKDVIPLFAYPKSTEILTFTPSESGVHEL